MVRVMNRAKRIESKLTEIFAPSSLSVTDESHLHAGHAGARPEGETHFRVEIVSETFAGQSRIGRHRAVNEALRDELDAGLHALAIRAFSPGEKTG